jgi:site-specific DNA-methyltransferase (adenine-specific)
MKLSDKYFNCDCMDVEKGLPSYPDNHFDLAIVDPNYGIGESSSDFESRNRPVKQKNGGYLNAPNRKYKQKSWDEKPPPKEYFDELIRVSKNQIIWGVNYYDYNFDSGRIIWDKLNGDNDFSDCELAFCSLHKSTRRVFYMWGGMFQGLYCTKCFNKANIQQGNKKLNEKRIHPTQKPIKLYKWLLKQYAKEGDLILDTHVGSGSSLIAFTQEGFDFRGYEIDQEYYKSSCERIIIETSQTSIYDFTS